MEYLTAKQTLGKLRQGKVTDISEAYFSQLVSAGALPFHTIPGKKRKLYLYDEVKKALADIQDPSREEQREEKRVEKAHKALMNEREKINTDYRSALEVIEITYEQLKEHTGYKGDVLEEAKKELDETQSTNLSLSELAQEQKEVISTMELDAEVIQLVTHSMLKLTVEQMMTVDDFYSFISGMD